MTENITIKPPTWFWIVSVAALLWNLFGVLAFFGNVFIPAEALAALPEGQQELYRSTPTWVYVVFAIGVFGGTLGCIALLLRKDWALPLFIASLLAVLLQNINTFFLSDALSLVGIQIIIFPILVLTIGIFLIWLTRMSKAKGWIT